MPQISQEELDRLRGLGGVGPLGAPQGEGLAARSIADYLRGGAGQPQPGYRGPLQAGGVSYGAGNTAGGTPNWRELAAQRGAARDAGASIQELQTADAVNRDSPRYNKRQQKALELARQSSPYHQDLKKRGLSVADDGVSVFHTRPDGSRDFNYSADGQYRGAVPEEFRNAPGDANTHDAHFNRDTGQWEAGDLSLTQTFKDIGKGFTDAYGNIRSTIPQIGQEVVSGVKGLAGKFGGGNAISGGGADGVGNFGAVGDFFGGIGDNLGLTSYGDLAAAKAAEAPVADSAPLAAAKTKAARETANSSRRRSARSNASQAQKAKQATSHTARKVKAGVGAAKAGVSGFNMGGQIPGYNMGGPLSRRDEENQRAAIAQSNVADTPVQQAPRVAQSGGGAGGGGGSPIAGLAMKFLPKLFGLNDGGMANPNGYNEGGQTGATPIKKEMDLDKMRMAREAFEKKEMRADEAHKQQMMLKGQQAKQAMTMKKEASTMKAPLSKGE